MRAGQKAVEVALRLLSVRARSRQELKERLRRKGFPQGEVEQALDVLAKRGYLDDGKFASSWARGRLASKPVGRARLRHELRVKGVAEELIMKALEEAYEEADEFMLAARAVERKLPGLQGLPREVKRRRLFGFLKRRGFPPQVIVKAVEERLGRDGGGFTSIEEI